MSLDRYSYLSRVFSITVYRCDPNISLSNIGECCICMLLVLAIMCHNIVRYVQLKGEIFKGLEHEPFWKKALVFVSGIKVNPEKLRDNSHYIPLESLVISEGGEVTRHLKVSPQLEEKNSMDLESLDGEIWVTPGLPFLIFVTIGFITAFFFGDFTTWLANLMLNL